MTKALQFSHRSCFNHAKIKKIYSGKKISHNFRGGLSSTKNKFLGDVHVDKDRGLPIQNYCRKMEKKEKKNWIIRK